MEHISGELECLPVILGVLSVPKHGGTAWFQRFSVPRSSKNLLTPLYRRPVPGDERSEAQPSVDLRLRHDPQLLAANRAHRVRVAHGRQRRSALA